MIFLLKIHENVSYFFSGQFYEDSMSLFVSTERAIQTFCLSCQIGEIS